MMENQDDRIYQFIIDKLDALETKLDAHLTRMENTSNERFDRLERDIESLKAFRIETQIKEEVKQKSLEIRIKKTERISIILVTLFAFFEIFRDVIIDFLRNFLK